MKAQVKKERKIAGTHIWDGILSGAIVLYATYPTGSMIGSKGLLSVLFILLALENMLRPAEDKRTKAQHVCVMGLYLLGAGLILLLDPFHTSLLAASAIEMTVLLLNRIYTIIKKPKKRTVILNVVCILLILTVGLLLIGFDLLMVRSIESGAIQLTPGPQETQLVTDAEAVGAETIELSEENIETLNTFTESSGIDGSDMVLFLALMMSILLRMILHVVGVSMSQMKLRVLMRIIRETYVLEVLIGLLLVIIVCSSLFASFEPNMPDFGDALWYCFALVTTIGFGDVTAVTVLGRVLSVFLGVYGIVVVAIITSVIVNFYGEMRRISDQKPEDGEEKSEDGNA